MTRENDMVDNPRHPAPPVDPHFKPAPHAPIDPHSHTVYDTGAKNFTVNTTVKMRLLRPR